MTDVRQSISCSSAWISSATTAWIYKPVKKSKVYLLKWTIPLQLLWSLTPFYIASPLHFNHCCLYVQVHTTWFLWKFNQACLVHPWVATIPSFCGTCLANLLSTLVMLCNMFRPAMAIDQQHSSTSNYTLPDQWFSNIHNMQRCIHAVLCHTDWLITPITFSTWLTYELCAHTNLNTDWRIVMRPSRSIVPY